MREIFAVVIIMSADVVVAIVIFIVILFCLDDYVTGFPKYSSVLRPLTTQCRKHTKWCQKKILTNNQYAARKMGSVKSEESGRKCSVADAKDIIS